MGELFVYIAATLVTIPLIGLYLVYLITVKITGEKVYSVKLAADCTTILFIIAVYFIILELWGVSLFWLIVLLFLFTAIGFTFLHWKIYEDIHILRVFRGTWRFQFFLFFTLYFVLMIYGLLYNIFV